MTTTDRDDRLSWSVDPGQNDVRRYGAAYRNDRTFGKLCVR
jgi:hypothetical protein